jgi:hypothetical protein
MDAQTVISATNGVIQAITTALTPEGKEAYFVAQTGAKMQPLNNFMSALSWEIMGFFLLLMGILAFRLRRRLGPLFTGDNNSDPENALGIFSLFSTSLMIIGGWTCFSNFENIVFNYVLYAHPDAALASGWA